MQSGSVIKRSNITWYCIHHSSDWGRIYIWILTHKRHPIARPSWRAMGCLLWRFWRKFTMLSTSPHCMCSQCGVLRYDIANHAVKNCVWYSIGRIHIRSYSYALFHCFKYIWPTYTVHAIKYALSFAVFCVVWVLMICKQLMRYSCQC